MDKIVSITWVFLLKYELPGSILFLFPLFQEDSGMIGIG